MYFFDSESLSTGSNTSNIHYPEPKFGSGRTEVGVRRKVKWYIHGVSSQYIKTLK